ncbi:DEAD/DEAH box helicase [Mesorhizobium sp. B2-4-17]|uniref:DEAD/DEAH box helicase n=1 Tax=Mesorhizobium sp. B2-4-17 TaxID=2589932 RepID=UPI00112AA3FD|nr:DEAD/DEAH box helicase [Mesorhizobium sp. B2-4-17]TPK87370.1 DEAD/DEAH box helicase [Mesorhizobium sp. B2-4-17]
MSEFHRVILGLHAQARRIDRDQALLGALGVGAFAYPHQIDSVHRMVTGTTCRWLLADEVGLGKTIQAIMVMRALAAQSPKPLTVALVVPDDLVSQWEEELLCRGHVLALESGEEGEVVGNIVMRLVRPSRLVAGGRIAAVKIDLLLVDEFTRLQVQVRRDLITAARIIPNVLAMTATPALHQATTRRELMALLEPEADRIAQAEDREILKVLADREAQALKRYEHELQDASKRRAVEEGYGLYRRLIRTARTDYPDALPKRIYQPIRLSPTDGDVERARTTRAYLEAARASNLDIRREALLQVAGRSRQSLRDRLSTLKRSSAAMQTAWRQIDLCLRDEQGDAKLDALVDHLRALHANKPEARVVVVAEDNPTTDYLRDAIEKLTDIKVARKRRLVGADENLEVQVTVLKEALDDFINGEAKVLVAADAAKEGHNLQFADEIIFFALPWSPPDIQQWIGRIDRLGAKGLPINRRIAITPIVVDGSIENNILEVLEGTGVFLRSEVFDESEWQDISDAISEAANGSAGGSWTDAAKQARTLGDAYDAWLTVTRLPPSSRTTLALKREARFRNRPYAAPIVGAGSEGWDWFQARELAAEAMMKVSREDYLDLRKGQMGDQRFSTVWYKARPRENDLIIPDLDARSSGYRQAYISRRAAFECPPRTYVAQSDERKRRLHFFDHGSSLHDGVIAAFERQTPATDITTEFTVEYPSGHPILRWEGRRLLLCVSEFDLRDALSIDVDAILGIADPQASKAEQDARTVAGRAVLTQFQADRRWMIDLCPPELLFATLVEVGEEVVAADAAAAIFNPIYDGQCARQIGKRRSTLSDARLKAARGTVAAQLRKRGEEKLAQARIAIRNAGERRCFTAEADATNFADAARSEIKVAAALDSKLEFNRAAQRGAALMLNLAETTWAARAARLRGVEGALGTVVALRRAKMFWVVPRAASEELP